jgi:ELWxxDGT repeat protein
VYNGKLYFSAIDGAHDGAHGYELWSYDGTTASLVADIYSGAYHSFPEWLTVYNGKLYFAANDGTNGNELWSYDGTTASLVADIRSYGGSSNPAWLTVYNGKLYFAARDVTNGNELWSYDGTTASLVADIYSGAYNSSNPRWLTVFNNSLFFNADGGNIGAELWILYDQQPASIAISGGSQSTVVNTAFANPITVTVLDQYGNAVGSGYTVTFAPPGSGASAGFAGGLSYTTDALGQVVVNTGAADAVTANTVAGTYSVGVSVSGGSNPTGTFSLTNLPDVPNSITISGGGQSTVVNTAFANPITVTVLDQYGNAVGSGYQVTFAPPGSGASANFPGGPFTTNASGQVVVTPTANTVAGTYSVGVSVSGGSDPTGTFSLTNLPDVPNSITISGGGQSTVVNTAFGGSITVTVLDQYNNPVGSGYTVTFAPPGSGASANFPGGPFTTNASGQVSVTPTANTVAGTYTVNVSVSGGSNPTGTLSLTNLPDVPDSITISGGGQSTVVNTAFANPITVTVLDQYNNPVGSGYTVTFAPPGSGASAGFAGGLTYTTDALGQVVVNTGAADAVTANTVAGTYTVNVSVSGGSNPTGTFSLTNLPDVPDSITISGGGQSTVVNTAFGGSITVTVLDQYNNPVGSGYTVTFAPPGSGASANFPGGPFTTNASGQVSVTPTANTVAGTYTVNVSVSGGSNPTGTLSLTNLPDVPDSITISGGGQSTVVNTAFANPITVTVLDQYNNPVGSGYTVTFAPPGSGASANFPGGPFTTNASGQVVVTPTANTVAGTYTVNVSVSGGSNPTGTFSLTNLPDVPDSITISGGGQSTVVNTAFGGPITVTVLDQYGNAVGSGYTVTFAPPGTGASANFPGGPFTTDASGQVSVTPTANTVAGTYTVNVSVSGGSNPTGTFSLTNSPDVPDSITISGGGQSTVVNTPFGGPITVTVLDQYGNAVGSGQTVTFAPPGSGASANFPGGPFTTNASGQVSVTPTANTVAGTYTVNVSVSGGSNPTGTFSLTNLPGAPASVVVGSGGNQSTTVNTAFSTPIQITVRDAFGNPVPNSPVAFFLPSVGASGILTGGPAGFTDANGQIIKTLTANTVAGTYSIVVQVVGGANPTAVISSLTNLPGPVAQIAYLAPVPSSVLVNSPIKPPVRVILQDQYGNRVYQSGVQVRLTLRKANNTHSPNLLGGPVTVTTNANGLARFVGLTITAPGTYKFRARVLNISGIPVILSNPFRVV